MVYKSIYRLGLHRDIFSHCRFAKTTRLFVRGKVNTLEVGTGGGVFTIELLDRQNILSIVEIDSRTAGRTSEKINAYFPNVNCELFVGDINEVCIQQRFHQIILLETLEHIKDDKALLRKLSNLLEPGGRLLISTPTATAGLLKNDSISVCENGDHVRVGYNGPELDYYLRETGLITIHRDYYGYIYARGIQEIQRLCEKLPGRHVRLVSKALCVLLYRATSFLDLIFKIRPVGQITLAIKVSG